MKRVVYLFLYSSLLSQASWASHSYVSCPEGQHTVNVYDEEDKTEKSYSCSTLTLKKNILYADDKPVLGEWYGIYNYLNAPYHQKKSLDLSKIDLKSFEPTTDVRIDAHFNPLQCGDYKTSTTIILQNGVPWDLIVHFIHHAESLDRYKMVVQARHPFMQDLKEDVVKTGSEASGSVISRLDTLESAVDFLLPFNSSTTSWSQPLFVILGSYPSWPVSVNLKVDYTSFGETPTTLHTETNGKGQIQHFKYGTNSSGTPYIYKVGIRVDEPVFELIGASFKKTEGKDK